MSHVTCHSSLKGRVLIIAGSDSGGGAGIQGDIKTVTCLGGYAMTAITALTAQNTQGVFGIHPVPEDFIAKQIDLCLSDIGADAVKTGMLHSAEVIRTVAKHVPTGIMLVVDPVMVAKGGAPLLEREALDALKTDLIHRAAIITPNIPEAELLLGRPIKGLSQMEQAATELLTLGCKSALLKGGHSDDAIITDIFVTREAPPILLKAPRINSRHTHGTGCALASAIATGLAKGLDMPQAVQKAHTYVQHAIANAPSFGNGHGPLGHWAAGAAN